MSHRPTVKPADSASPSWRCVEGHELTDLDRQSEWVTLDGGARIRVCREHGAPVAVVASNTVERPLLDPLT